MKNLFKGAKRLGLHLTPEQLQKYEVYYRELTDWNTKINHGQLETSDIGECVTEKESRKFYLS